MGAMASQTTSLTIVYSTVYSDADQRKYQSSAWLACARGFHRVLVNSPHKRTATGKVSISWRHHDCFSAQIPSLSRQALTALARLPGVAQNGRRATVFVGRSCPPNSNFENSGNKVLPASAHCTPYARSWFCKVFYKVTVLLNQLLLMIPMLSSALYSGWLYDQLCNGTWFELPMQIKLQYLEWLSIDRVQGSGITGPVNMGKVYVCRISTVRALQDCG